MADKHKLQNINNKFADSLKTLTNLLGGFPSSEESNPTPWIKCAKGMDDSSVLNASSSLKCLKYDIISL